MMTRGTFNEAQVERLLRPIREERVFQSQQGHASMAAWDISAHLTRMFGFGNWEKEIISLALVGEHRGPELGETDRDGNERKGWYVTYRCELRVRIRNEHGDLVWENDDVATGTSQNQPHLADAHDAACKNAVSFALKRCTKDLGDQFGLSLYNKGSKRGVVGMTLVKGDGIDTEPSVVVEGDDTDEGRPFE